MIQVYVTQMPESEEDCPFYNYEEDKCVLNGGECCLRTEVSCEHLLNLSIL